MTPANRTTYFGLVHACFLEKWLCARQSNHRMVLILILRAALARESLVSKSGKKIASNA